MKTKKIHSVLLFIVCPFFILPLLGQESQGPVLYYAEDMLVKPSRVAEFKEAIKKFVKIYAENEVEYRWDTYQTDDFHFYFTIPMKNYEDVGSYFAGGEELIGKIEKEELEKLNKLVYGSIDSYQLGLYYYRPDLSYIPEKYAASDQESAYLQWSWFYIFPEKQIQIEEIASKWVEEYKSENISMPYYVWTGHIGGELPMYLYVWVANDQEDFQDGMAEINQKLGEKASGLRQQTFDIVKRMEIKRGWSLPGLSYIPEISQ